MKVKLSGKMILTVGFLVLIFLGGILTLALSPVQVLGGLVRGYISAPEQSNLFEKVGCSFKEFDNRVNEYFVFHDVSVHSYGGIQRVLGKTLINDTDKNSEVLKLNNGYLTFKRDGEADLTGLSRYLLKLKSVCDSTNSELVYVQKVDKNTSDKQLLPQYYPYVSTSNFKTLKPVLEKNGVEVVDLEQTVFEEKIDKYSLFFKTDHHWTAQTGIWVAENIYSDLNERFGWNLDTKLLDTDRFSVEIYPQSFLGSEGKRVGALYAGLDDFAVVKPQYETSFTVKMQDIETPYFGNFEETMLFEENITPDNLLNKDTTAYMTYMMGNHPLVTITNHSQNQEDGKTALLIMDSYGCVVAPYLALGLAQLDCIDIRYYSDSVEEYIEQTSPDVVIYAIENHQ